MKTLFTVITVFALQPLLAQPITSPIREVNSAVSSPVDFFKQSNVAITTSNQSISEKIFLDVDNDPTATLENVATKIVNPSTIAKDVILANAFTAVVHKGYELKKPFVFVEIPKYIRNASGQIEELLTYKVNLQNGAPIKKTRGNRVYATNSVLADGTWFKVSIAERGMHKIDFDFVKNKLGVDPSTINPAQIGVFGNGGTQVPEDNRIPRPDDLVENAIQLIGMQDGSFDNGDYILFYANGSFTIAKDSLNKKFRQSINIYSDNSFYFLNFTKGSKRIASNTFSGVPTTTVTSFNDFQFINKDSINLGSFGKRWFGQQFGNRLGAANSRTFNFSFPNISTTDPLNIFIALGGLGYVTTSNFATYANGTLLGNAPLLSVGQEYYDPAFSAANISKDISVSTDNIGVRLDYTPGDDNALGYLDYIEINARRTLSFSGNAMIFADWNSVAPAAVAQFQISNATASAEVWDITNALLPIKMNTILAGTTLQFVNDASSLHTYIAINGNAFTAPSFISKVDNQNLHALNNIDYIIVTHPNFIAQAKALASHHQYKRNLRTAAVTTTQVYNEFGSGSQDISAIRDFAKMLYDKAINPVDFPKNILLFGDASFDFKDRVAGNSNFVPTRETDESANKINGYCSDDFFGILDDNEFINAYTPNTLDIGVGRLPAGDATEANNYIYKINIYDSSASFGAWKNNATYCADNRDGAAHFGDAEIMSGIAKDSVPNLNLYKVYVDAFPNYPTPGGDRAPQAKQALDAQIFNGTSVINYNGHGGPSAWCDERIFTSGDITSYNNIYKLPLYITATCDFGPYNNPFLKSAAEKLLSYNKGGAIALMTTTQLVFQYENRIMNSDYWKTGFTKMSNGQMPTLGDALRLSKNRTYINGGSDLGNYRKFALLGDPALQLNTPTLKVVADSLNGVNIAQNPDTLKALNIYNLTGRVLDANGNTMTGFNGIADITIFDKAKQLSTLGNNAESPIMPYKLQNATVFRGKASVVNGVWKVKFIVPKDIDYNYGFGKISMYASNSAIDASGYDNRLVIGGTGNSNIVDNDGPVVKPYMNNTKFINGGITGKSSTLLVLLSDDNGINTSGSSIGHDITAIIDENSAEPIVLNNFYDGEKDNFKAGEVRYPLKDLAVGKHTITVKAWDIVNNSNQATVDFVVKENTEAQMERVFNYPNPFTTNTNFCFEHNFPGEVLYVTVQVFSVNGSMVRSIHQIINAEGSRVDNIAWDGKDEMGDPIGKGVYLYKIYYKTQSGISVSKYQKLIKL